MTFIVVFVTSFGFGCLTGVVIHLLSRRRRASGPTSSRNPVASIDAGAITSGRIGCDTFRTADHLPGA
jgi:hypothetical protein